VGMRDRDVVSCVGIGGAVLTRIRETKARNGLLPESYPTIDNSGAGA
jgi:hypothetical protein